MASGQQNHSVETKQGENPPPYSPSEQQAPPAQHVQQFVQQNPYGFVQQQGYGQGYPKPQQGGFSDISNNYGYNQPMMSPVSSTTNNSTVVVTQPQSTQMLVVNPAPNSNMGLAIFTCFCCCWLLGIGAIIASAMSQSQSAEMRYDEARKSANISRILSITSLVIGIVCYIIIVVLTSTNVHNNYQT